MKRKDQIKHMESGRKVAVDTGWKPQGRISRSARPAVIIAVGQKRYVSNRGRSYGHHIVEDGVRVRYDEEPTSYGWGDKPIVKPGMRFGGDDTEYEDTTHRIVAPRDVLDTWTDYRRALQAHEESRQSAEQRREAQKQRAETQAKKLRRLAKTGSEFSVTAHYHSHSGGMLGYYSGVQISPEAADLIIEALEARS